MSRRGALLANLAGVIGCSLTGGSIVATRYVIPQTDAVTLAFLRYLIAVVVLAPVTWWLWRRHRPSARDLVIIFILGLLLFGLFPWLFSLSLNFTTAARGALALAMTPLIAIVLSSLSRMEGVNTVKIAAVLTAIIGVAIALADRGSGLEVVGPNYWIGDALMLSAAAIAAFYAVASKPILSRIPALLVTCLSMIGGVIGLAAPAAWIAIDSGLPDLTIDGWASLAFLGIGGGALQFGLWVWAVSRLTPTQASLFLTLTPIVAIALGVALLAEPITASLVIGLCLVIAAILGANWRPVQRPR